MTNELKYWPFPFVKPESEWSEYDRDFIDFMNVACAEGFRPRTDQSGNPEAGDPSRRYVFLCFRGLRNGWEPFLCESGNALKLGPAFGLDEVRCVVVRPFRSAAHFALEWLRGRPLETILSDYVLVGGSPTAIELRPEAGAPR